MAEKIQVEFELNSKDALKNVERLEKEVKSLQDQVKKSNKETEDQLKDVEKGAKESSKGVQKVGASLKNIAKVTGVVFLLQKAFEFVSSAIQENQTVMDGLNLVFETAQIIFNQVVNTFIDVYKNVSAASENFDALGKVVKGIVTLAFTPLKLAFYAIKLGLQVAQLAWEKSFFGDKDPATIKALQEGIQETKNDIVEVAEAAVDAGKSIVNNFAEAVNEAGAIGTQVIDGLKKVSIESALETAKSNVALKKSAEIAAAQTRILLEQKDREAEKLRQIRDEERNSIDDRIKANNDLKAVLEDQEEQMIKNANTVLAAAQAQFNLTGKQEDYVAVLDAVAEKEGVLAQIEGFRSEQKSNDLALDKEKIELTNSKLESESNLSIERQRFNAELIQNELTRLQKLKEVDELEAEQEAIRLQAIVDNANAGTQAKIDAQIALDDFTEQSRQTNLQRNIDINEAERELDKQKIQDKKDVVDAIAQFADAESGIGQALLIIKQGLALKETIMDLKRITFKGVEAIGAAGVSTAQNVAESSKIGFPQNIITIASAIAQGVGIMRSVKKAVAGTKAKAGAASASVPSVSSPSAPSEPPAFNVVGASDTNQLAEAIGGQAQQPIQTYVVASEVSTAQELDRNIVTGATIG